MDPDAALSNLRYLFSVALEMQKLTHNDIVVLNEQFEALDGWLSRGGFLPQAWVPEMGREVKETPEEKLLKDIFTDPKQRK
jgi:hypothetical protein